VWLASGKHCVRAASKTNDKQEGMVMTDLRRFRVLVGISALLFISVVVVGCAKPNSSSTTPEEPEFSATEPDDTPTPLYYDFDDVLVPSELKVDRKRSFVYHTDEFTAGVLVLSGRVEINSLIRFFDSNMAKDNWRLMSSFKSPRTILFFTKANRSCIINITEQRFDTEVEIWVAPTKPAEDGGLLLK
jgi:hypothetical protein